MPDLSDLSLLLADLHEPSGYEEQTLDSILAFACHALQSEAAGVMLAYGDGHVESLAFSDKVVARGDELQMMLSEGPCLSSKSEAHVDLIADTSAESRWPAWGPAVHHIGIRSVLSIRLAHAQGDPVGSLNIYNHRTGDFGCSDVDTGQILARHASVVLAAAAKTASLFSALESPGSIGQAQGILMERYGIDADQAFAVMRNYSDYGNVRLREVARRIADTGRLPHPEGQHDSELPGGEHRHTTPEHSVTSEDRDAADERDGAGDVRDETATDRDGAGTMRDSAGAERDQAADAGDRMAEQRDHAADVRDQAEAASDSRISPTGGAEQFGLARRQAAADRHDAARDRLGAANERREARHDRDNARSDRGAGATQRHLAAADRAAAASDRRDAAVDGLTGAYTRRAGTRELEREIARAARSKQPLMVAFLDVDGLKAVNDSHGHTAGDQLLRDVVQTLRANLRPFDLVIRYGGDDFVCVLPGMGITTATKRLANINPIMPEAPVRGTITMGLAELQAGDTCETVVSRADAAFYRQRRRQRSGTPAEEGRADPSPGPGSPDSPSTS